MRPRFEIVVASGEGERLLEELANSLRGPDLMVRGRLLPNHAELTTCKRLSHVWSPRLMLHIESADGGTDLVRGRFSPHPNVWTGFVALYAVFGMGALFAATLGISQATIGQEAWGFWGAPICLGLIAFTYGAAFIGQGLGAEEMYMLRSFVDQALRNARARAASAIE